MASAAIERVRFNGSYHPDDVEFLLKPVRLAPTPIAEKERLIQSGARHYSEMIAAETPPDAAYLALYDAALGRNGGRLAGDIATLASALADRGAVVIASLARAGTPIGVLLVRALRRLGVEAWHYSISIVRDRGIDRIALAHIARWHDPARIVFVDGWTGKGAIAGELRRSLADRPFGIAPYLAVVTDPAGRADLAAGGDDYLIASGLLNGVVSGLISRSILNDALVGPDDFHACVHYADQAAHDLSHAFVDRIDRLAREREPGAALTDPIASTRRAAACDRTVAALMRRAGVRDRNRIKPGIAEATRAVLRRAPEKILLRDPDDPDVAHLCHLAAGRAIPLGRLGPDCPFRAVTIIRAAGE